MRGFFLFGSVLIAGLATSLGCGGGGTGGSTSTGSGGLGGSGGQGGSVGHGGSGGSGTIVLTNNDATCVDADVAPSQGEDGRFAAARLTPPSYPFVVTSIRYKLSAGSVNCKTGLAHGVDVFTGTDVVPPATPVIAAHFDNAAEASGAMDRIVTHDISPPITLMSGEHLFIAVQMVRPSDTEMLCVGACEGPAVVDDRNYWSDSATPPYGWSTLGVFSLFSNYAFDALGHFP